jgi:hypothetical protein
MDLSISLSPGVRSAGWEIRLEAALFVPYLSASADLALVPQGLAGREMDGSVLGEADLLLGASRLKDAAGVIGRRQRNTVGPDAIAKIGGRCGEPLLLDVPEAAQIDRCIRSSRSPNGNSEVGDLAYKATRRIASVRGLAK